MSDVSYININGTQYTIDDLQATQELADVRVGADGQTYASAGEAVRAQIEAVNESMTAAQGDITAIYDEIDTVKGDVSTAQGDITTLQGDVSDLQTDVSAIEGNIASEFSTSTTYAIGDYCVYNGSLYKAIAAHTGAWSAADFEEVTVAGEIKEIADNLEAVDETLENKANIDGSYETMTVGNAEQLVATVGVDDNAPYNFRTSGGSVDIGDRETVNAVVGGTVAWNQLAGSFTARSETLGVTVDVDNATGTVHAYGTATSTKTLWFINNRGMNTYHKFFLCGFPKNVDGAGLCVNLVNQGRKSDFGNGVLFDSLSSSSFQMAVAFDGGTTFDVTFKPQLFDLTAMFGSTIADYIYSLEQANEGAGVAWFKKLFPKPYYPYNAGELLSVNTSQHKMVGFNAFDKSKVVDGFISNTNGEFVPNSTDKASDYIKVIPNATYYIKTEQTSGMWGAWYDANKQFISGITKYNLVKTAPANARFARLTVVRNGDGNLDTFCINLSWDGERDGEYEPYQEWVYPLDSSLTLRGIPKLDASGNLYYDGDTYAPDGTVTRKYGVVDLGTLNWAYVSESAFNMRTTTSIDALLPEGPTIAPNAISSIYPVLPYVEVAGTGKSLTIVFATSGTAGRVWVNDSSYSDAAAFKAAMSGVMLVYELAEPTTETAEPYTQIQSVDDFGTEEYTDYAYENGDRDVAIPVGHNTVYSPNLRAKLEMSPNSPDGDGLYVVEQSNGQNEYVPLVIPTELPTAPSEDGTYTLKITVSGGTVTKSWIAEE